MTEPTGTQTLATQDDRTPRRRLHDEITSEQQLAEFKAALPENVSVDKFRRALSTAINEKPELIEVYEQNPRSLFSALSKCASAGLLPDGKQAAINVYNTKQKQPDGSEKWVKTAQFLPMKDGLRFILAQYGWMLRSRVVYTNDFFQWSEEPPSITHRPAHDGERGERAHVYSIAEHRDGRRVQRVLNKAEVEQRKKKAKTDKIWNEWPDQMWEKSGDHAIFDDVPLDETERDRIKAILDAQGLLADPTAAMYGAQDRPALTPAPDETPQAAPAAPPAGGGSGFDYNTIGANQPDPPADEPERTEAQRMGQTVVPGGPFADKTIAEAFESTAMVGEPGKQIEVNGKEWLLGVLGEEKVADPSFQTFRQAVEAYVRGEQPDMWASFEAVKAAA